MSSPSLTTTTLQVLGVTCGYTLDDLAAFSRVPRSLIVAIERGRIAYPRTRLRLACALGVTPDAILWPCAASREERPA